MAKTNYQYEKRQRELKKSQQQEDKRHKKRERKETSDRPLSNPEYTP